MRKKARYRLVNGHFCFCSRGESSICRVACSRGYCYPRTIKSAAFPENLKREPRRGRARTRQNNRSSDAEEWKSALSRGGERIPPDNSFLS